MEGALGAWEALQHMLEVAVEDLNLLKVWAWVEQQDIDPNKGGDFIIHDGCVHTVRLTSIGNPVPGYQEFLVAHIETIVGLVKKIRSLA